MFHNMLLLMDM